jgi:exodeoxyribonuclease V gamma subunit
MPLNDHHGFYCLSNRLESLFDILCDRLFLSETKVFSSRQIIVPSWSVKDWLQRQFAKKLGISMGMEFFSLEGALARLGLNEVVQERALALRIEQEMAAPGPWPDLGSSPKRRSRRARSIARDLARLFHLYSLYGRDLVLGWESRGGDWQGELWRRIYREGRTHLSRAIEALGPTESGGWHLFAFSHLSPTHYNLFQKIEAQFYLLSPCAQFWGDLTPERAAARWMRRWHREGRSEAQIEEMRSYLSDGNPLLANLGKVIQQTLTPLDDLSCVIERYVEPGRATLLCSLQSDFLNLEQDGCNQSYDPSIEIRAASSRLREIELVYDRIAAWVKSGVAPERIIVMAPDIGEYAPYIKALFDRDGERIPHQIREGAPPSSESLQRGFSHLLRLAASRWEVSSFLKLLNHPLFAQKQGLGQEELGTIQSWVDRVGICWGIDKVHRSQLLQADYEEPIEDLSHIGTWEEGFSRLLGETVSAGLEMSSADLLEELISLVRSLEDDLAPLCDGTRMKVGQWANYLRLLLASYFSQGEAGEFDRLEWHLLELERDERWVDGEFGFGSIRPWIEGWLQESGQLSRSSEMGGVRFGSMLAMRMIPSGYICLIGLDEGSFPQRPVVHPLDQLQRGSSPSCGECDRELFLEAILSARTALYLSFPSISSQDGQPQPPSAVISELVAYFRGSVSIQESSPLPFDPANFSSESPRDYQCAEALGGMSVDPPHRLAIQLYEEEFSLPDKGPDVQPNEVIDISSLRAAVRDPLRLYFHNCLRLYLEDKHQLASQDEEAFQLSHLERYSATLAGLKGSVDRAVREATASMPHGPFRDLAVSRLKREILEARSLLKSQGVDPSSWYQVSFTRGVDHPYEVEGGWIVPPITLGCSDGREVQVTGTLSNLSPAGLNLFGENRIRDAIKGWPDFLLYCALSCHSEIPMEQKVHFAKGGGSQTAFFADHIPQLEGLINYYHAVQAAPCPVHPDWAAAVLAGNGQELRAQWAGQRLFTPYVQRTLPECDLPCAERAIATWRPLVQAAFGEMAASWYEKRRGRS